ncbi:P-loop containing nucleoside triphosphate hydrolase protein [Exidia glandulosa HHB12029]|uniref:RNA helicase n=1 Tax=Exidia glandulosa HHB12029 TaxID=1314781 RepID=A0A166A3Z0_EXIGL|nr:P-loop containing nucleoside triphosphate hydrolase protein [Exidia glandulosa HHB12029]
MAKKKRTQLKPVARGFATTSVPKKAAAPVDNEDSASEQPAESAQETPDALAPPNAANGEAGATTPVAEGEFSFEKAEEHGLQVWIEKNQDKTEREIVRTLKTIEYDRRFAKSFPPLALDDVARDKILELALSDAENSPKTLLDEAEDKVLARLGVTYGVLRRLGFNEDRVTECLNAISGVELDEAIEWLYLHSSEEDIAQDLDLPDTAEVKMPRTPRTTSTFLASAYSAEPPPTPPTPSLPSFYATSDASRDSIAAVSDRSTPQPSGTDASSVTNDSTADTSTTGSSDDELERDPNADYAKLKLRIHELEVARQKRTRGKGAPDDTSLKDLRARLEKTKKHYFFKEKEAEALYRAEKTKADTAALNARLKGLDTKLSPAPKGKRRTPSIAASSDDDEVIGIFGSALEEIPKEIQGSNGAVITVKDMSLPKHWAGRTPKTLLSETVSKLDRYAVVTYRIVGGESRVMRAGCTIRWEGGKVDAWEMSHIGCPDATQAEQYIATVALHSVSFTTSEGFAGGGTAATSSGNQTYFRTLPPSFRDLWDELEGERKRTEDAQNRAVWAKLRTVVEPKIGSIDKSAVKSNKAAVPSTAPTNLRTSTSSQLSPEQIMAGFAARQASYEYQEMLVQRNRLPIAAYRHQIVQALEQSQVLVLSGETGCGKSTQLPAFILEDQLAQGKHCKIYCTEPRRISAISLAQRVSQELGDPPGAVGTASSLVGYSIRLESNTHRNTRLAFVTNGIALRMLENGSGAGGSGTAFDEITHIIIDEVHERTIESDFLLIVLKSLLLQRPDLKIVLMSATLNAEKVSEFFGGCPIMQVPGRTFPVDIRYLEDAIELTGWQVKEGTQYAKRLNDKFNRGKSKGEWNEDTIMMDEDEEGKPIEVKLEKRYSESTVASVNMLDERVIPYDLIMRLLECICFQRPEYMSFSPAILIFMPGLAEIRRMHDTLVEHPVFGAQGFILYPLHSTISSENQSAVFDIPPPGVRKIVIATNIAETGITIPDITCVIDTGKHREMRFDEKRQISRLVDTFVARSNAAQRRGRAGRVQTGLCFHLFTKLRHDTQMADSPLPEMLRLSLSDLALRIKIMNVKIGDNIEDVLTRAMDPPSQVNIQRAISSLIEVRALTPSEEITPMGRLLSKLPVDVHLGKFLLVAALFGCLDPALTIAATLNAKSPFLTPFGHEAEADRAKLGFMIENSDFLTLHNAFSSWRRACGNSGFARKFCRTNYLSHQNLQQIEELRQQLLGYLIDTSFINVDRSYVKELNKARYGRNRSSRFVYPPPELDRNATDFSLLNAAMVAGLYPRIISIDAASGQLRTIMNNQAVAFHPSSVNFGFQRRPRDLGVNHLCYFTIMQSKKLYAWETGGVDDVSMLLLCGEIDTKLVAESVALDRKIRFRASPKTNLAVKYLREQLSSILAALMRGRALTETQQRWYELAVLLMGRQKPDAENGSETVVTIIKRHAAS